MKKLMVLSLVVLSLITLGVMVGCQNSSSPNPGGNQGKVSSIEMRATHYEIQGYQGETRNETIVAIPRDAQGNALKGIRVEFAILNPESWKGGVARVPSDSLSNDTGYVRATYSVVINRSTPVQIEARSGSVTSRITITISIPNDILGPIGVTADLSALGVPPNQTKTTNITARIQDVNGAALQGMRCASVFRPPVTA